MDAYHVSSTRAISFCRLFIFHNNLIKEILVSFVLINETRLREVTELDSTARL